MSGFIPKEQLGGYQRWQIASFDRAATTQPVENEVATTASTTIGNAVAASESMLEIPFPTAEALEQVSETARAEGFRIGYDEGRAAAQAELEKFSEEQIQNLGAIVSNLQVSITELDQNIADQLLDLALEVAAQVLRGSLAVQRDLLLPTIREAVAELPLHHGTISLHFNPDDANALRAALSEQLAHTGAHIVPDRNISPGGCRITAGNCEIDARIETRWKRVIEAIGAKPREWLPPT